MSNVIVKDGVEWELIEDYTGPIKEYMNLFVFRKKVPTNPMPQIKLGNIIRRKSDACNYVVTAQEGDVGEGRIRGLCYYLKNKEEDIYLVDVTRIENSERELLWQR